MRWSDPREAIDVGIGFVGFFALAFVIITAVCELMGLPALGWAVTSLVLVLILVLLWQTRRRVIATRLRVEEERARAGHL